MQDRQIDPWDWQQQFSYSQAREISGATRTVFVAGQTSISAEGAPLHEGDMAAQLAQAFENLEAVLAAADLGLGNVVRLNYFTTDVDALFGCWSIITDRLGAAGTSPASTLLGVSRLAYPQLLVEIEATAVA